MERFKLIIMVSCLIVSACVSNPSSYHKNSVPPLNKAISMSGSWKTGDVYSLYGIKLGEARTSVEDTYKTVMCREGMFFLRCLIPLDIQGVSGVSLNDTATIFISFKDDRVHSMNVPILNTSLKQARKILIMLYGEPSLVSGNKVTWSNDSSSVVLEKSNRVSRPFSVNYIKRH